LLSGNFDLSVRTKPTNPITTTTVTINRAVRSKLMPTSAPKTAVTTASMDVSIIQYGFVAVMLCVWGCAFALSFAFCLGWVLDGLGMKGMLPVQDLLTFQFYLKKARAMSLR
jgi:hypothetical protein